ncbi:MAG TPA: ferritin family protein, partial [Desulfobacteria bacterium]|nr:ferritin family protein [Desulfobacteria bacterium]
MGQNNLTVADVAQMAVDMETKGMHFYNWAAKQFDNRLVREIFLRLSEDEKEHIKIFQKLLASTGAEQQLKEDSGRYIKMIGQRGDIFPHHDEIARISSPAEAL